MSVRWNAQRGAIQSRRDSWHWSFEIAGQRDREARQKKRDMNREWDSDQQDYFKFPMNFAFWLFLGLATQIPAPSGPIGLRRSRDRLLRRASSFDYVSAENGT